MESHVESYALRKDILMSERIALFLNKLYAVDIIQNEVESPLLSSQSTTATDIFFLDVERLENSLYERQQKEIRSGISRELYKLYCMKMKVGVTSKNCTICYGSFERGEIINQLPCKHIFHSSCVKPWLKRSSACPNCRFDIQKHHMKQTGK